MKNTWKKYAAIAMAGVLSAGMLSGCGDKKEVFDGTKTVATINGEEIPMGVFSFVVRNQQAYLKALYESYGLGSYLAGMYDSPAEEGSDMTYGEQTKYQMLEQVETMYLMKNKAAEYGVEITAEEEAKLAAAAEAFIASNSEETIKTLGVT
ncbi:MAG: FKBP-type peptidylprolyl isomerase, partial [Clostridiales bacterium]|nr:FKBP-type peptidylprolyl isomerase [Candidatus Blautia equi]